MFFFGTEQLWDQTGQKFVSIAQKHIFGIFKESQNFWFCLDLLLEDSLQSLYITSTNIIN